MSDKPEGATDTIGRGQSVDVVTDVRSEIIKLEKIIADCADPSEKDDKYQILLNMKLRQIDKIIRKARKKIDSKILIGTKEYKTASKSVFLENGNTLEQAESDYKMFKKELKSITLPKVTFQATLRGGGKPATKIKVDNQPYGTPYNDSSLEGIKDMARTYAYELKVEKYANLDVLLNEYIDVGWDKNPYDPTLKSEDL